MALRLLITDAICSTLEPLLRESKHAAGAPPRLSDRLVIEAVLYQARTGPSPGATCPTNSAIGMPSISGFAVGRSATSGRGSGNRYNR